jgi:uncharacterized membrane protein YheB (UPF0754 family)
MSLGKFNGELNLLEKKLHLLINKYRSLKEENLHLKRQNEGLRSLVKEKDGELADFQKRLKISKIVEHVGEGTDVDELKTQIDEYIKDIDKCIMHLGG